MITEYRQITEKISYNFLREENIFLTLCISAKLRQVDAGGGGDTVVPAERSKTTTRLG